MTTRASQPPSAGAGAAAQSPARAAHARPAETGAAPPDAAPRRGLVLGGGGMLGAAWTVGALCAVEEATGRRPDGAEVLLGTSAGAILAALLAGGVGADQLRDHQRGLPVTAGPLAGLEFDYDTAVGGALPPRPRVGIGSPGLLRDAVRHPRAHPLLTTVSAMAPHGRGSLATVGELVRGLHGPGGWPDASPLRVAAVDYRTGHRVVFGDRGAPPAAIADAVMASCAIPGWFTPVRVHGSAYVDGGCWSATNADLMIGRGLDEVFVLAPMALRLPPRERDETGSRGTLAALREWHAARDRPRGVLAQLVGGYRRAVTRQLMREAALLRASGVRVHLLAPTPADLAVMGPNLMDPARRAAVLESSLRTSRAALDGVR
ncbi:patatin-like phospholipase family protein [Kitasatospora sp. A2-31]|uniref:patatin-like phospholipase family protein n=1 Tax=Kitasatospora sp. A2-31 TaxID=2916414 RepID=UPI001EEBA2B0|nr:patatin-like phospholipase family protein [Kitasatospora sp. A2-31]MCG6496366.1 patatin-like phospholipase family protein [Kitasatospora sp. A2-31]